MTTENEKIFLSPPELSGYEKAFIEEALASNWIAPLGPQVDAFEKDIATFVGTNAALALNSGTAALHLALIVLDVGPGDTVFCSDFTFVASANPICYQHAKPVFIDACPETWTMSAVALEKALGEAEKKNQLPKAVIVTNIYGQSADYDALIALCEPYGIPIIEDAAESLGATYKGRASGTLGTLGVYSFNGNKIITTSGGGMLVSNNQKLIDKARYLSTQAREDLPYYEHKCIGYNYRMSNILAAIGRGQLKVLEERVKARQNVFRSYQEYFQQTDAIDMMPVAAYGVSSHWLTVVHARQGNHLKPEHIIQKLAQKDIEARHVWKPMHMQPVFEGCAFYSHAENVSEDLFERGVCLPSGGNLSIAQHQLICNTAVN